MPSIPTVRLRLRKQALDWLRADLASRAKQLQAANPNGRAAVERTMQDWQKDADLAGVRDPEARAKLPEAERNEWDALWAEVQDNIERALNDAHCALRSMAQPHKPAWIRVTFREDSRSQG
jgi:hypothetical protein